MDNEQQAVLDLDYIARTEAGLDEDRRQVGRLALVAAIRTWKPGQGTTLSTYATTCVKNALRSHWKAERRHAWSSLDDYAFEDGDTRLVDLLRDERCCVEAEVEQGALVAECLLALGHLPERERIAVQGLVMTGQTGAVVAERLGVSKCRAYYLRDRGLRRLQRWLQGDDGGLEPEGTGRAPDGNRAAVSRGPGLRVRP